MSYFRVQARQLVVERTAVAIRRMDGQIYRPTRMSNRAGAADALLRYE